MALGRYVSRTLGGVTFPLHAQNWYVFCFHCGGGDAGLIMFRDVAHMVGAMA